MTFKSLEDEHQHFLNVYHDEKRWQVILEHRRIAPFKQQAREDWSYAQSTYSDPAGDRASNPDQLLNKVVSIERKLLDISKKGGRGGVLKSKYE